MKVLTGKQLVDLLEDDGWKVVRIEGSHYIMRKPGDINTLSIPVHKGKTIKPGLLSFILKKTGLK
jgi:predicted RNA binding protein YcfA (HicA-like mRNA interferase family)